MPCRQLLKTRLQRSLLTILIHKQTVLGIAPGTVFVPMHWGALWALQAEANALTHPESCPDSLQPELKACAVQLVPVAAEEVSSEYLLEPSRAKAFSPPVSV